MNASEKSSRQERRELRRELRDNYRNNPMRNRFWGGFSLPIILIIVGLVFLAVNTGLLPTVYAPLFSSWPIWLVFGGLFFLLDRSWFTGLVLLTIGAFYLLPQIGAANPALNIPANFAHLYWPALLVIGGVYFILSRLFPNRYRYWGGFHKHFDKFNTTVNTEEGFLAINSSFDSRKEIVLDPIFKGGNIDCSFGEVIVDLRKTTLQEGKTILTAKVSFGSVHIIVPSTWNVQLKGDSAFGDFRDSRIDPSFNPDSNSSLIIQGKCSFGEFKLRD